jgi:hypothetical protein
MKRVGLYNYENYLNTISLLRERLVANKYLQRTRELYKRPSESKRSKTSLDQKSKKCVTTKEKSNDGVVPEVILPIVPDKGVSRSSNKLNVFNFNNSYHEQLLKRQNSKGSLYRSFHLDKSIADENKRFKQNIRRISSPLTRVKLTKDYDLVYQPVMNRLKKVIPNRVIKDKLLKLKVTCLNLK